MPKASWDSMQQTYKQPRIWLVWQEAMMFSRQVIPCKVYRYQMPSPVHLLRQTIFFVGKLLHIPIYCNPILMTGCIMVLHSVYFSLLASSKGTPGFSRLQRWAQATPQGVWVVLLEFDWPRFELWGRHCFNLLSHSSGCWTQFDPNVSFIWSGSSLSNTNLVPVWSKTDNSAEISRAFLRRQCPSLS